jgi:GNAT superfamily N-acetyltransferase
MSLDLNKTAFQVDDMARHLRARTADRMSRLHRARETVEAFEPVEQESKRLRSVATVAWNVPAIDQSPATRHPQPRVPDDFCVVGVDGSHIDVDRNIAAQCYLINIGAAVLTYGSGADASLFNIPHLYADDDDLAIRDRRDPFRRQPVEGTVLGAKRTVDEIRALVDAVKELPGDQPTLALVDGSLLMIGLVGRGSDDFVARELIEEGLVPALDELRSMARARPLVLAGYISLPRSGELVSALRLALCPFEVADCRGNCGEIAYGERPCDAGALGLMDRDLYGELLDPGERSAVFASSSRLVDDYYGDHGLHFFYVNGGDEIARIEIPSWVAEDQDSLGLAHALIVDQCRRGLGYPTALMEAHEQAVVTGSDREYFVRLVEDSLTTERVGVYSSRKSMSKRLRWL